MSESTQELTVEQKKAKAYSAAQAALREAHREEYHGLVKQHMAEWGIEWEPRPDEKEKARRALLDTLREYPDLLAELQTQQ